MHFAPRVHGGGSYGLSIYATNIDCYPGDATTQLFFKTVQNKMHWAAHGNTAAEIVAACALVRRHSATRLAQKGDQYSWQHEQSRQRTHRDAHRHRGGQRALDL